MNPVTFSSERLDREPRLDPVRFRREYLAEFADAVAAFLAQHLIDQAIRTGRYELPPRDEIRYVMGIDPSGGGADSFTCSVVHAEGRGARSLLGGRPDPDADAPPALTPPRAHRTMKRTCRSERRVR